MPPYAPPERSTLSNRLQGLDLRTSPGMAQDHPMEMRSLSKAACAGCIDSSDVVSPASRYTHLES